jgi:GTPase SAR1 family protein
MFIQIGYEELLDVSSFSSFENLIEELNDLLGENTYVIENNGKKIDLSSDYQLVDDETYKIWPKVLGGKVRIWKKMVF